MRAGACRILRLIRGKWTLEAQIGEFILALPMLVFAMVAHEYAHGAAALSQGDDTALMLGRLTLNPVPHIDPWMSLILPGLLSEQEWIWIDRYHARVLAEVGPLLDEDDRAWLAEACKPL